jgi:hypothetical protein
MLPITRYYTIVRLDPASAGIGYKRQKIAAAECYFYQQYPELRGEEFVSTDRDRQIQIDLLDRLEENISLADNPIAVLSNSDAGLLLRCYISHFMVLACQTFVKNFSDGGTRFRLQELLAQVLTDDGKLIAEFGRDRRQFVPESLPIIRDYLKRDRVLRKSLSGWTYLRIRQSTAIEQFLLERGLYLESDWGILNATSVTTLKKIWGDDNLRVEEDSAILQSYHIIYRGDRRKSRQHGRCQPPTDSQQQRILADLKAQFQVEILPQKLMSQLQAIAQQLRDYRIACENLMVSSESLDVIDSETGHNKLESLADPNTLDREGFGLEDKEGRENILHFLQDKTITSLDWGIERGFKDILEVIGNKSKHLIQLIKPAFRRLYCQQLSQTEVATQLQLTQTQVSRNIKPLAPKLFDRAFSIPRSTIDRSEYAAHFYVAIEVWEERQQAIIRGFIRHDKLAAYCQSEPLPIDAENCYLIPVSQWETQLDRLLLNLRFLSPSAIPLPTAEPSIPKLVQLTQWLDNLFDAGWQAVDALLGTEALALSFRNVSSSNRVLEVKGAKLIDLGLELSDRALVLLVAIAPEAEEKIGIRIQLHPCADRQYLPANLELKMLSQSGETVQEVRSRDWDTYVQLRYFKTPRETHFSVQVALGDRCVTEAFWV